MTSYRLAVVGGGNMGAALVGGLLQAGWAAADLAVVEAGARALLAVDDDDPAGTFTPRG